MSVVLMLDGLDEAQDARRLEVYVERLTRYNYDYFKIVLTSRSGYNADRLLRVRQFTQFELQGLTRAESAEFWFCRKVRFLGQNPKIGYQEFNELQTLKCSKKQLCDRTRRRCRCREVARL
jgi:hypothetical protein